jgi:hypothetical protein
MIFVKPVPLAIEALKHMLAQNDKRIKKMLELGNSWNNDASRGVVHAIVESWRKDSDYLKVVLKVLQSESKPKKKNKSMQKI